MADIEYNFTYLKGRMGDLIEKKIEIISLFSNLKDNAKSLGCLIQQKRAITEQTLERTSILEQIQSIEDDINVIYKRLYLILESLKTY